MQSNYFHSRTCSELQLKLYTYLTLTFAGLSIYSLIINFTPSSLCLEISIYISTLLTVIWVLILYRGLSTGIFKFHPDHKLLKRALAILFSPIFFYIIFYASFTYSIPGLATKVFGLSYEAVVKLEKENSYSRHSCRHRLIGPRIRRPGRNYICITENEYINIPSGFHDFKLTGSNTAMGLYILNVSMVERR
jgi:hypothetical protein